MDSNLLKVFVSVAEEKSISLAAKTLGFAQSNVTSRIKQLEKTLGYSLFHRIPKGVILTSEGEKLFPHAIDIVQRVEKAEMAMTKVQDEGLFRIGSTECNAVIRIVPFLTKLNEDYPKLDLELLTGTTETILEKVLNYQVDIAFITGVPNHKDLLTIKSFNEEAAILEPKETKETNKLLTFKKGCGYSKMLLEYQRIQEKGEPKVFEFGSLETILGCVKAGMGKTLLPIPIVKKFGYYDDLKITKLTSNKGLIPTSLICRKDNIPLIRSYLEDLDYKSE